MGFVFDDYERVIVSSEYCLPRCQCRNTGNLPYVGDWSSKVWFIVELLIAGGVFSSSFTLEYQRPGPLCLQHLSRFITWVAT